MATTRTKAAVSNGETNVSGSAPFYVLHRSKSMGYYYWTQLLSGRQPAGPSGGYETPAGFETESAAIEAIKAHKSNGHHYDYLVVRALSLVEVKPVVETVVTEVKL